MKALTIPSGKSITGLYIYCSQCKYTSKETKCKHYDKQSYKARFHIPGTQGEKASKVFPTRDIDEAIKLTLAFQSELESVNYQPVKSVNSNKPTLLIACMAKYVDYLADEDDTVEEHQKKNLSEHHINEVERCFRYAQEALLHDFKDDKYKGKYNLNILLYSEVNDRIVGKIHKYFIEVKKYEPRTYNKYVGHLKALYNWLMDKEKYRKKDGTPIDNPFADVNGLPVDDEAPESISQEEFLALLEIITPENGRHVTTYHNRKRDQRTIKTYNYYKPWLKDALWLFLLCGDRRENTITLRFNMAKEDRQQEPVIIEAENLKVNRIQGRKLKKKRITPIPITTDLRGLLYQLGYAQYRGTDRYLLAADEPMSRKMIMEFTTKAFTHYYRQLNTGKKKTLKHLRKTYLTSLEWYLGRGQNTLTHSEQRTLRGHYIDPRVIAQHAAKGFKVFEF